MGTWYKNHIILMQKNGALLNNVHQILISKFTYYCNNKKMKNSYRILYADKKSSGDGHLR